MCIGKHCDWSRKELYKLKSIYHLHTIKSFPASCLWPIGRYWKCTSSKTNHKYIIDLLRDLCPDNYISASGLIQAYFDGLVLAKINNNQIPALHLLSAAVLCPLDTSVCECNKWSGCKWQVKCKDLQSCDSNFSRWQKAAYQIFWQQQSCFFCVPDSYLTNTAYNGRYRMWKAWDQDRGQLDNSLLFNVLKNSSETAQLLGRVILANVTQIGLNIEFVRYNCSCICTGRSIHSWSSSE